MQRAAILNAVILFHLSILRIIQFHMDGSRRMDSQPSDIPIVHMAISVASWAGMYVGHNDGNVYHHIGSQNSRSTQYHWWEAWSVSTAY